MTDPYGTAALRAAVLDTWAGSPTRFREDANAEEDLRLGGYAHTWLVELAQNAADAARAAGAPGRVRVAVAGGELRVANTGAPLDAAGVTALASLRASAKRDRDDSVGRFGVGFAAVLALSDEPRVVGAAGGVAFSAARTAAELAALPGPAAELARRDGQLPILRLVWPVGPDEQPPPAGYDTEVRLPLRAGLDPDALLAAARAEAAALLLALLDLVEIVVDGVVLRREDGPPRPGCHEVRLHDGPSRSRWLLARRAGRVDAADAAALAVEQRGRVGWSVCWALPLDDAGRPAPLPVAAEPRDTGAGSATDADRGEVLYAPTATAERLSLPARLFATVPLDPDRRHVRAGPVTDRILAAAATAYVDLVRAVGPAHRLGLVPAGGFPRSAVDGQLRELLSAQLRVAEWLPDVEGVDLSPGRAQWLDLPGVDAALLVLLARCGAFSGLLAVGAAPEVLGVLGVARLAPAELVDRLLGVEMAPEWWRAVYAELAPAAEIVPGLADELRALPVPLVVTAEQRRARTVAGPATVLLPEASGDPAVEAVAALGLPGLHVAHPAAVHPLLSRLGAGQADAAGLLGHPAVHAAVERSLDDAEAGGDPAPLAAAVLGLVAAAAGPGGVSAVAVGPGGVSAAAAALAALALPDDAGGVARADELMFPDAALRPLLAHDAPLGVLDPSWTARFGREALATVGVVDGFAVLVDDDPAGPEHDLDDERRWWATLEEPPARLVAVRDLDLVGDDAWPAALALLAARRDTREAVTATSYTAWWLRRHARLSGHRPGHWRLPSALAVAALYDPVPDLDGRLDDRFLAAIGVRTGTAVADAAAAADLLARLADPARRPDPALVAAAHEQLAAAVLAGRVDPADVEPPSRVRALDGGVVDVDVAVLLDLPWLAVALPPGETVTGARVGAQVSALAELLDLPLASEVVVATVEGRGRHVRWAELTEVVLACQVLGVAVPDGELSRHEVLTVAVTRPVARRCAVPAWRAADGHWHAADPVRALLGSLARPSGSGRVAS